MPKKGQRAAVLVYWPPIQLLYSKHTRRIKVHEQDGLKRICIKYRRDWERFQSELLVLELTGTSCQCTFQRDYPHKIWKFVDQ